MIYVNGYSDFGLAATELIHGRLEIKGRFSNPHGTVHAFNQLLFNNLLTKEKDFPVTFVPFFKRYRNHHPS